jgi:histidinol-phosphatase (PHP family)
MYVKEAIRQGFDALGFSAHAPLPFANTWSIRPGKLNDYLHDIRTLKQKNASLIRIAMGLEIDYIPGVSKSFADTQKECGLDYVIGGVHLVSSFGTDALWFIDGGPKGYDDGLRDIFQMDIKKAVGRYFEQLEEMVLTQRPQIIAHCDKIKMNNRSLYFSQEEPWYKKHLSHMVDVIAASGCIAEVNTRGIYKKRCPETYPSVEVLKEFKRRKVPVIVSTDAHHPDEISLLMPETICVLEELGFRELMVLGRSGWEPRPIRLR